MPASIRRRWITGLRASLLLVFALGLFWQSLLGPLGDLHEMMEHGGIETTHPAGLDIHAESAPAEASGAATGEAGIPHVLLHYAHCCGHVLGLPSVAFDYKLPAPAASKLMLPGTARIPAAHLSGPFRPPIQA